jgi:hypothetical protein
MRLDHKPDILNFNGSGLPIPEKGVLWISLIKVLTFFKVALLLVCQYK